jgi:2-polyprenyl-3-methyl-5-hydroxy-6-metoxy-1,4-benzoquinol methylase
MSSQKKNMRTNENEIKTFYISFFDKISDKRLNSKYKLRRCTHFKQYESILNFVRGGMKLLDVGCGDGALSIIMAKRGAIVTACDLSEPNLKQAQKYAEEEGVADRIKFLIADSENLPFANNEFDLTVSSHVLEHLPDFDKGLSELMRVTKKRSIVAIPTIFNLCSLVQVGGGTFWEKRKRSFFGFFAGIIKMTWALLTCKEGVDEHYAGSKMPHIFRFPWIMKAKIRKGGYKLVDYEASSICLPFFEFLLPITQFLDKYKNRPLLKNLGYGTTYVIEKLENI